MATGQEWAPHTGSLWNPVVVPFPKTETEASIQNGTRTQRSSGPYSQPLLMEILRSLPEYLHVAIKPLKFP